jgi:hypothetical protein
VANSHDEQRQQQQKKNNSKQTKVKRLGDNSTAYITGTDFVYVLQIYLP